MLNRTTLLARNQCYEKHAARAKKARDDGKLGWEIVETEPDAPPEWTPCSRCKAQVFSESRLGMRLHIKSQFRKY